MEMRVVTEDFSDYDAFVMKNSEDGGLMQSSAWWKFQIAQGRNAVCGAVYDGESLIGAFHFIERPHVLGIRSLYMPRGPVLLRDATFEQRKVVFLEIIDFLRQMANARGAVFIEIDPGWMRNPENESLVPALQRDPNGLLQPVHTMILDVSRDNNELLGRMHQKTRYNIGLAERKGMTSRIAHTPFDIQAFIRLLSQTRERQEVRFHKASYYTTLVETLTASGNGFLMFADWEGKPIAANFIAMFGNFAYYLFGGSDFEYRNLQAPTYLQWQCMKEAKSRGCLYYDLWGVAAEHIEIDHERSWAGITRFKRGFAPDLPMISYLGVYREVLKPWKFRLYKLLQKLFIR